MCTCPFLPNIHAKPSKPEVHPQCPLTNAQLIHVALDCCVFYEHPGVLIGLATSVNEELHVVTDCH